ncbi:MAG: alpha/beta fold hydrolase [Blastocatellales bacterium]
MSLPLQSPSQAGIRHLIIPVIFLILSVSGVLLALAPERVIKGGERRIHRAWMILNGKLVLVNGHYLRVERKGRGGPTVVFDSGLSQTHSTWGSIPDEVAGKASVIVYERAGVGESDHLKTVGTSSRIVDDLHELLEKTGAPKPYILVGHSFGGMNIRLFASRYPNEVSGLLLIDASHEDQFVRYAELMPSDQRASYLRHERGENLEGVNMLASGREVRAARFGPIPAIILTAGADRSKTAFDDRERAHLDLQSELVKRLPGSRQIIAEKSGHFIQKDQPELVVKSILELAGKTGRN